MQTLWIRLKAPFAAFRHFQAGVYRSTCPIIPYSAAWGLALNLAGLEIRTKQENPITEIDPTAPSLQLAIGAVEHAERNCLYQQLHSYRVGTDERTKEMALKTKGAKYWIAPVKREILVGLDAMVGIKGDEAVLQRIDQGLKGELNIERYGLPFAGDNNLLFDDIQILNAPVPSYWYTPLEVESPPAPGSSRMTVCIDRVDSSNTSSQLAAPQTTRLPMPPESAWTWTPKNP